MDESNVILIVGLGNIGTEYELTRHNIGFLFVDFLAAKLELEIDKNRFHSLIGSKTISGRKIILAKPQTFMNKSGIAISEIIRFFKVPLDQVLVVFDDLDQEFGKIKLKKAGGDAGHNGIKSINSLAGKDYHKLKIGIGRPEYKSQVSDYVLSRFNQPEMKELKVIFDCLIRNFDYLIKQDYTNFLNHYHLTLRENGI